MTTNDDPLTAHIDAAAPPGTHAYYALLFSPEPARLAVGAVMALSHELEQLAGKNPETAAFRMNWWAEELQRLGHGRPSHPVTVELLRCGQNDAFAMTCLGDRFKAATVDIEGKRSATADELTGHLKRRHGSMQSLTVRALGSDPTRFPDYPDNLGIALGLVRLLATAPIDAAAGRVQFPADILAGHGVDGVSLTSADPGPALTSLATAVGVQVNSALDCAIASLPAGERGAQRTGLVQAALLRRTVGQLARTPPDRWLATAQLGGFGPLYLAWRAARRAARGKL